MPDPLVLPPQPAARNRLAELAGRVLEARIPLGSYDYGLGVTLNDVLRPLTDTRGSPDMLPESFSLGEAGSLLAAVPGLLDPGRMASEQVEAINTPADPNEPYGQFKRLAKLFPMADVVGVSAPVAPRQIPGSTSLGTYLGRKSQTANLERLAQAEKMESLGASSGPGGETRPATGWFKDKAGDWKYEVPDNGFVLRDPYEFLGMDQREALLRGETVGVRLGDMAEHAALFGGHPQIADYGVLLDPKLPADTASFSPMDKTIHMGIKVDKWAPADHRFTFLPEHRLTALHEITHGVQHEEGFAQGGNPSLIARHKADVETELVQLVAQRRNMLLGEGGPTFHEDLQALTDRIDQIQGRLGKFPADDYKGYLRLLGEAEARDVEARADLDPAARQMSWPYASTGIPGKDMIVRKRGAAADEADISLSAGAALDLSPEARAARAAEQGYTIDAYHGTQGGDIGAFASRDGAVYVSQNPATANEYAGVLPDDLAALVGGQEALPGSAVYPVKVRASNPASSADVLRIAPHARNIRDAIPQLRAAGFDSYQSGYETIAFDPTQVRSRFAAFDPARAGDADLLASRAGVPAVPPQQPEDPATEAARNAWILEHLRRGGT
jgi:hypothetical protein